MESTWNHPQLGTFKRDGTGWINTVNAPGFDLFAYDTGYSKPGPPNGKYELAFDADNEADVPSAAAIALASTVLVEQDKLVPKVTKALWDDFNGRGPNSGMWWHGGLSEVAEVMGDADWAPPDSPDSLLSMMRLFQITVRKGVDGYEKPIVELSFHALFEEEHGVGILTDGHSILGTGYILDVTPFK